MSTTISGQLGIDEDLPILDANLHVSPPEDALREHLPERFQGKGFSVPNGNWSSPVGKVRDDVSQNADPEGIARDYLDVADIEHAVLTPAESILRTAVQPDRRYAAALTSAYNDWLLKDFLGSSDRLAASIAVTSIAPEDAAAEIRRLGDRPDVVQVIMGGATNIALGEERYWPIYEAAVEQGLPVAIHSGTEGYGIANANTGAGYPSTYLEAYSVTPANAMGQLLNLVLEGPFVEFSDLRMVFGGMGYSWVPSFLWRIDKMWQGLTDDMPWVERPPSEYVREHVRFVTHPIDEADDPEHTRKLLEMLHAEETLMFGSNYPHWDSYAPGDDLPDLDPSMVRSIFGETAANLYGL